MDSMKFRPLYALCGALTAFSLAAQLSAAPQLAATKTSRGGDAASITAVELQEWLSYIASDQLQGRQVYTEGLGYN
jgi:hypothetical protein